MVLYHATICGKRLRGWLFWKRRGRWTHGTAVMASLALEAGGGGQRSRRGRKELPGGVATASSWKLPETGSVLRLPAMTKNTLALCAA